MYSIKPGRGVSCFAGIIGLPLVGVGIWMLVTALEDSSAPGFVILFCIIWVIGAIGSVVSSFYNAFAKERITEADIVRREETFSPFESDAADHPRSAEFNYCPYCGSPMKPDFKFCGQCGKPVRG